MDKKALDIEKLEKDGHLIFALDGQIDLYNAPVFRDMVYPVLDGGKPPYLIFDLEKVKYIDSSGLATLIEIRQKVKDSKGSMYLVGLSDKIANLFQITKFDRLFDIFSTIDDVLNQ